MVKRIVAQVPLAEVRGVRLTNSLVLFNSDCLVYFFVVKQDEFV